MRVLVTRPLADGQDTASVLAAQGHVALVAPLLTTEFFDGPMLALAGVQAILATSANGVRALARRSDVRTAPLFAVGPQTAQAAQQAGFRTIRNADGDAAALAQAAMRWATPGKGALLHVCGEQNAGGLAERLTAAGFQIRREILYVVKAADTLPPQARSALQAGAIDAALFYSPRSAAVFRDCALKENLPVAGMLAACISKASAAALAPLAFAHIRVAAAPHQDALLALLAPQASQAP